VHNEVWPLQNITPDGWIKRKRLTYLREEGRERLTKVAAELAPPNP